MRQSIGEWFTYNMIIVFIIIVFGLLTATLNYYKAYKVNSRILSIIEKYEGYNQLAIAEITEDLTGIGYTAADSGWKCSDEYKGGTLVENQSNSHYYCVYYYEDEKNYSYSAVTYIFVDLPIVGQFKIPVKTKGERIYKFSSENPIAS